MKELNKCMKLQYTFVSLPGSVVGGEVSIYTHIYVKEHLLFDCYFVQAESRA